MLVLPPYLTLFFLLYCFFFPHPFTPMYYAYACKTVLFSIHLSLFRCPGILQCEPSQVRDKNQIFRLFCHECQRVFHDRLINNQDKTYFNSIVCEMASKNSVHFAYLSVEKYPFFWPPHLSLTLCQASILALTWSPHTLWLSPLYLGTSSRSDSSSFIKNAS